MPPCSYCTDGPDDLLAAYWEAIDTIASLRRKMALFGTEAEVTAAQRKAIERRDRQGARLRMIEPVFMDDESSVKP